MEVGKIDAVLLKAKQALNGLDDFGKTDNPLTVSQVVDDAMNAILGLIGVVEGSNAYNQDALIAALRDNNSTLHNMRVLDTELIRKLKECVVTPVTDEVRILSLITRYDYERKEKFGQ